MSVIPWLLIGTTQAWLHLAAATPPQWTAILVEAATFGWVGFALSQLANRRGAWLAHPAWAAAAPLVLSGWIGAPSDWRALPFVGGWAALTLAPTWWLVQRWPSPQWPWWGLVPLTVLGGHVLRTTSADALTPPAVMDRLSRDLRGPLWAPPATSSHRGAPILLISVDTLRADDAQQMQVWRRLAERGVWWPAAQSTSSWTLPAMGSLVTGLSSSEHGAGCVIEGFCQGLGQEVTTLAQRLNDAGYATIGISANPWAGRRNGFDRGFDRFHDLGADPRRGLLLTAEALLGPHPQDGQLVVDLALHAMDELAEHSAWFLWIHLIDPHLPYLHDTEAEFRALQVEALRNANLVPPSQRAALREAYRAQVAYTDQQLFRLFSYLEARGLLEETIIVFTSDHGEEFWEHGGVEHGHSHHAEVVEVPLVFSGPRWSGGAQDSVASILDVAPTLLAAVGQPVSSLQGVDLQQPVAPTRVVTAEGNLHHRPACSAISHRWRIIAEDCQLPSERLDAYRRDQDPAELRPLDPSPDLPEVNAVRAVRAPSARSPTWQATEGLKALGYVD